MEVKWSVILSLAPIYNERGATLIVTIILLFFVSQFILSIKMWHDNLYTSYSSLEVYYERQAVEYLQKKVITHELPIEEMMNESPTIDDE